MSTETHETVGHDAPSEETATVQSIIGDYLTKLRGGDLGSLPAILGLTRSRAFGGRLRRHRPRREDDGRVLNNGVRWARFVGRRPVAVVLLMAGALSLAVTAWQQPAAGEVTPAPPKVVEVEKLRDNLYMLKGGGGNTAGIAIAKNPYRS